MNSLLLAFFSSWQGLLDSGLIGSEFKVWLDPLMKVLTTLMWVAMALVGAAGGIYAVYVGIKMARADSAEAREENKKRLINIVLTIVAVIALILVFNVFLPMIIGAFTDEQGNVSYGGSEGGSVQSVVNTVRCLIGR